MSGAPVLVTFGEKFLSSVSSMMLGPLAWIGNKYDLFVYLASEEEMDYGELATASGCNERYIQEWLHAMTCAEWITYNEITKKFSVPEDHKPLLVRGHSPGAYQLDCINTIQIFNECVPKYLDCFKNGGGLKLEEIHPEIAIAVECLTKNSQKYHVPKSIEEYLPEMHERLIKGIQVADVGSGVGHALVSLAKKYPNSTFTGFEPHKPSYHRAQANILEAFGDEPANVTVLCETSAGLKEEFYDFITTWDVVHDLGDPISFLKDIYTGLKSDPDAMYLMNEVAASHELTKNLNANYIFAYSLSMLYCTTVSLADGGPGYGACMGETVPEELCKAVGFSTFFMIPESPSRLYIVKK